jgi:hypothetical protein
MPFQVTQRQSIVFIAGLALGIAVAWAVFGRHSAAPQKVAQAQAIAPAAKSAAVAPVSVAVDACAFSPIVATAAGDDGRVQVQEEVSGRTAKDVDTWILDGKEAVAAGRQRDAEADFLMACRAAEKLDSGGVLPQAEAMYHLGRHYAALAGAAAESRSGELWRRAESLFAASLQAFNARYGDSSDKTRFAAKGLAEAREHTSGAPAVAAAAPATHKPTATAKVAEVKPPPVVAKVQPPKEIAQVPAPAAAPKAPEQEAPEQKVAEQKAAEPKLTEQKVPEQKVADVKPAAPKPRPLAPAAEPANEPVMEPPSRAVGSATGQVEEPADTTATQ